MEFKVQMPKYLSVNQRTIIEMLADEMGDKNAKRVMNLGQYNSRGVEDGMRLRVMGEGDYPPTGQSTNPGASTQKGDLYVFIRVAPDNKFSRNG